MKIMITIELKTTTDSYTLSLHDALPIWANYVILATDGQWNADHVSVGNQDGDSGPTVTGDRKSTRLNSSHVAISYAVFCLKKKRRQRALRRHCYTIKSNLSA